MDTETHELIAAYALDALDDADRVIVEELLISSEEAREELRSFSEVAAAIAVGATGPEPRAELRDRIIESARAERQVVVPLARPASRARLAPILVGATAIAATVALALGLWGVSLSNDLRNTRATLDHERTVGSVLSDPAARTIGLVSKGGKLVIDDRGQAVLIVESLEAAPAGKAYQVWVVEDGAATAAGQFSGGSGRAVVPVEVPVTTGSLVAVTVEDAAGVDRPTTTPVVTSTPA